MSPPLPPYTDPCPLTDQWRGQTAVIVAGGPSLVGFDWSRLDRLNVIAINRAFQTCRRAEVLYWTDSPFYRWHDHDILRHPARFKVCGDGKTVHPDVVRMRLSGPKGLDLRPGRIRHGNNSGFAAMNVAAQMGVARIILLGYDMKRRDGRHHWHEGHPTAAREHIFKKMVPYFETLMEPLHDLGIEVVNACPDSAITCFDRRTIDEALP